MDMKQDAWLEFAARIGAQIEGEVWRERNSCARCKDRSVRSGRVGAVHDQNVAGASDFLNLPRDISQDSLWSTIRGRGEQPAQGMGKGRHRLLVMVQLS